MITETYRDVKITLDEKAGKWGYCANRQRWTSTDVAGARRKIDSLLDDEPQHNGANSNLYCDGQTFFVTGCPACDASHERIMKPRYEDARLLGEQLKAAGVENVDVAADLWKISAKGDFHGRTIRVQDISDKNAKFWWIY